MGLASSHVLKSSDATQISEYSFTTQDYPKYMNARKYRLQINRDQSVKYKDFLHILTSDSTTKLADDLIDMISDHMNTFPSHGGYFFETPPITYNTYQYIPFEFMLIPADELAYVGANFNPFSKKFSKSCQLDSSDHSNRNKHGRKVVSFSNINNDSTLVVPCPVYIENTSSATSSFQDFAHISRFMKNADKILIRETLKRLASETMKVLTEHPNDKFWVSTSGLGVSWIHFRIDSRPKYYNWEEYKTA